ncbi:MAG: hypothetical protein RR826_06945 [Christensenellaceae bacterium]
MRYKINCNLTSAHTTNLSLNGSDIRGSSIGGTDIIGMSLKGTKIDLDQAITIAQALGAKYTP